MKFTDKLKKAITPPSLKELIGEKNWIKIDGSSIKVKDMTPGHIKNCIHMLLYTDEGKKIFPISNFSKQWVDDFEEYLK